MRRERKVGIAIKGQCEGSPWWWECSVSWLYPLNGCVVILCCDFARRNHQRKLGKDARDLCDFLKLRVNLQLPQTKSLIANCVTDIIATIY